MTGLQSLQRRIMLLASGGLLLTIVMPKLKAAEFVEVMMSGTTNGAKVWFSPQELHIKSGQTVRWVNADIANVHTVTAYHPANNRPLGIPANAISWDSGYLMPGESFSMQLEIPGVYDYFCIPHELAGMVGRIVVETNN